ncbi:hypothetical protein [Paludisphaera rhizosphaerae]|uniref:hypothetical protein n=1 Tax=Paludisphaera rhizosphaerae TaxID=2711216 RepID=UPI0013EAA608|nr:hypothetical protein [Paludisphaera rhizosphaerae]
MSIEKISEIAAKTAVEITVPIAMDAGATAFCEAIPLDWLEKLLMGHHDDHGEFAYSACAKDIKARLIKQAGKNLFSKQGKKVLPV